MPYFELLLYLSQQDDAVAEKSIDRLATKRGQVYVRSEEGSYRRKYIWCRL